MKFLSSRAPNRRWRWAVGIVAAGAIALGYAGEVHAAPAADAAPTFSAADLADAVLFETGPAEKYLADLERPAIEWTDAMVKSRSAVDAAISKDSQWGSSFAGRMQSGDPNQISTALDDLAVFSRTALNNLWGKDQVDKAIDEANAGSTGRAIIWADWVYIYKYFVFLRYVVIAWTTDLKDVTAKGQLPDEITISTIAQNLSTKG